MYLLSFRVIGHSAIPDVSWLKVGRGVNVIRTCNLGQAQALIKMLQTVNPPYDLKHEDPFRDLPRYTVNQPYPRKIIDSKKTVALAIFAASPHLVKELSLIDPVFYETDRIEFGRRRDQSRWINFVELSAATRWGEIEATVRALLSHIGQEAAGTLEPLQNTMAKLCSSDRIKGDGAAELKKQVAVLRHFLPDNEQGHLDECLFAIDRAQHFRQAKTRVEGALPLFLSISKSTIGHSARKTDITWAVETPSALLAFLTERLKRDHEGQGSFAQLLEQINLRLQTLHPELPLKLREEGSTVVLEVMQGEAPLPLTALTPVRRIEALLSALATMHEVLHGCQPIFLIDIGEMQLKGQEQADLLHFLLSHASHWQYLVIPDRAFLDLCGDSLTEGGRGQRRGTACDVY